MPTVSSVKTAVFIAPCYPFKIGDTLIRVIRAPVGEIEGFDSLWYCVDSDVYYVTRFMDLANERRLVLTTQTNVYLHRDTLAEFKGLKLRGVNGGSHDVELFHLDKTGHNWRILPYGRQTACGVPWVKHNNRANDPGNVNPR